jgi:hypothetical protein
MRRVGRRIGRGHRERTRDDHDDRATHDNDRAHHDSGTDNDNRPADNHHDSGTDNDNRPADVHHDTAAATGSGIRLPSVVHRLRTGCIGCRLFGR